MTIKTQWFRKSLIMIFGAINLKVKKKFDKKDLFFALKMENKHNEVLSLSENETNYYDFNLPLSVNINQNKLQELVMEATEIQPEIQVIAERSELLSSDSLYQQNPGQAEIEERVEDLNRINAKATKNTKKRKKKPIEPK